MSALTACQQPINLEILPVFRSHGESQLINCFQKGHNYRVTVCATNSIDPRCPGCTGRAAVGYSPRTIPADGTGA